MRQGRSGSGPGEPCACRPARPGRRSFAYFSLALNLTIYLTDEFGITDQEAGWVYGLFGVAISITGLIFGVIIDKLGVRHSLWIGAALKCVLWVPRDAGRGPASSFSLTRPAPPLMPAAASVASFSR